jgi:hypothetical protein
LAARNVASTALGYPAMGSRAFAGKRELLVRACMIVTVLNSHLTNAHRRYRSD